MKKALSFLLVLLVPAIILPQEVKKEEIKKDEPRKTSAANVVTTIPVLSQYSEKFKLHNFSFNKKIDIEGKGDVLEVEFILKNQIDNPQDLYIFVIATFEKTEKTQSSFEIPISEKERIRSFVPFPFDIKNFEYPDTDSKGNVKKDENGHDRIRLIKFPKDPKLGINPYKGQPYHLKDNLLVRTLHVSKYRTNYFYFNEVAVLIFDSEGKPVFRQLYSLEGFRRKGLRQSHKWQ